MFNFYLLTIIYYKYLLLFICRYSSKVGSDVDYTTCTCPTGCTKCHHMVSLLLHGHNNISVTDVSCSWSEKVQ